MTQKKDRERIKKGVAILKRNLEHVGKEITADFERIKATHGEAEAWKETRKEFSDWLSGHKALIPAGSEELIPDGIDEFKCPSIPPRNVDLMYVGDNGYVPSLWKKGLDFKTPYAVRDFSQSSAIHRDVERTYQPKVAQIATHNKLGDVHLAMGEYIQATTLEGKKKEVPAWAVVDGAIWWAVYHQGNYIMVRLRDMVFGDKLGSAVEREILQSYEGQEQLEGKVWWHRRGPVVVTKELADMYGNPIYEVTAMGDLIDDISVKFATSENEWKRRNVTTYRTFYAYPSELFDQSSFTIPKDAPLCIAYSMDTEGSSHTLDEMVYVVKDLPRRPRLDIHNNQYVRPLMIKDTFVVIDEDNPVHRRRWMDKKGWTIIDRWPAQKLGRDKAGNPISITVDCVPSPVYYPPEVLVMGETTGRLFVTNAFWLRVIKPDPQRAEMYRQFGSIEGRGKFAMDLGSRKGDFCRYVWKDPDVVKNQQMQVEEPAFLSCGMDIPQYNPVAEDKVLSLKTNVFYGFRPDADRDGHAGPVLDDFAYLDNEVSDPFMDNYMPQHVSQLTLGVPSKEQKQRDKDPVLEKVNVNATYWKHRRVKASELEFKNVHIMWTGQPAQKGKKIADIQVKYKDNKTYTVTAWISETLLGEIEIRPQLSNPLSTVFFAQEVSYQWAKRKLQQQVK